MNKTPRELLHEARTVAVADAGRARDMFGELAASSQHDVRFDAELELGILAYKSWDLDEVVARTSVVLFHSAIASPWARAVAGVLFNVVRDHQSEVVDEALLEKSSLECVDVGDSYMAAVGLSLCARRRLANEDREAALRLFALAEQEYYASGSLLGGPQVALELASLCGETGDVAGAQEAVQRGLVHLAGFVHGGQSAMMLADRLRTAAGRYSTHVASTESPKRSG